MKVPEGPLGGGISYKLKQSDQISHYCIKHSQSTDSPNPSAACPLPTSLTSARVRAYQIANNSPGLRLYLACPRSDYLVSRAIRPVDPDKADKMLELLRWAIRCRDLVISAFLYR